MTIEPAELDSDPVAINVRNGTLRLVREEDLECPDPDVKRYRWAVRFDPHDRADRISKCLAVDYDRRYPQLPKGSTGCTAGIAFLYGSCQRTFGPDGNTTGIDQAGSA